MIFDLIVNNENELSNTKLNKVNSSVPTVNAELTGNMELEMLSIDANLNQQSENSKSELSFKEHFNLLDASVRQVKQPDIDHPDLVDGKIFPLSNEPVDLSQPILAEENKTKKSKNQLDINDLEIENSFYDEMLGNELKLELNSNLENNSNSNSMISFDVKPSVKQTQMHSSQTKEKYALLNSKSINQLDHGLIVEPESVKSSIDTANVSDNKLAKELPLQPLKNVSLESTKKVVTKHFHESGTMEKLQYSSEFEESIDVLPHKKIKTGIETDFITNKNILFKDGVNQNNLDQVQPLDKIQTQILASNKEAEVILVKLNRLAESTNENGIDKLINNINPNYLKPSIEQLTPSEQIVFKQPLNTNSQFSNGLSVRIQWMLQNALSSAEIMLDPPELGPLNVKLNQVGNEANIVFNVNTAVGKETLEENLAKLKEMLQEQGIKLGDATIQYNKKQNQSNDNSNELADSEHTEQETSELVDSNNKHSSSSEHKLLDTFV
ncbi:MAG: flagellar hook-length control protein FliK [Kangiellaceae bacterium]